MFHFLWETISSRLREIGNHDLKLLRLLILLLHNNPIYSNHEGNYNNKMLVNQRISLNHRIFYNRWSRGHSITLLFELKIESFLRKI